MNNKVLSGVVIGSLVLGSIGLAAWVSTFTGMSIVQVASTEPVNFTSYLETKTVDVTNSSINVTDSLEVLNIYGSHGFHVDYDVLKSDVEDSCTSFENDVGVEVAPLDFVLNSNEIENVEIRYFINRSSCPQNVSVQLNVTALEV